MKPNPSLVASRPVIEGEIIRREHDVSATPGAVVLHTTENRHSVALRSNSRKRHATPPVVSITPEDAQRIIDAAENDRDRLLLTVLWQTGCRISEALELRGSDIEPTALYLRNLKHAPDAHKLVPLPAGSTLTAELALWQKAHHLEAHEPLFMPRRAAHSAGIRPGASSRQPASGPVYR